MSQARVKKTGEVITIEKEQDGHYLKTFHYRSPMTGRPMKHYIWYRPDELEVVE